MIPLGLINAVIGLGVPAKFAKPLIIFFTIAALVIAAGVAKRLYDKGVVEDALQEIDLSREKSDRKADNAAAEQRRKDDARVAQETQELKDVVNTHTDPAVRKREFYRCVRLQQTARQNGLEPPACV
jgi:hypothetical protein